MLVWLQSPSGLRWLLRGTAALLVVAMASCFAVGAGRPRDPHLLPAAAAAGLDAHSSPTSRVDGFGQIGFRVVDASANVGPLRCALLADKADAREAGMKGRRDLAGYDAMVFRWPGDSSDVFVNQGVPIALSVAWFDVAGVFVGARDMPICAADCPTFAPDLAYHLGLEVPRGGLRHLGVSQGSVLLLGGHC
ncbi:MAG: DUF192 domain-containing protein [Acidimicrobiales bacterium]